MVAEPAVARALPGREAVDEVGGQGTAQAVPDDRERGPATTLLIPSAASLPSALQRLFAVILGFASLGTLATKAIDSPLSAFG